MTSWNRTFALLCALTLSVAAAPAVQAADEGPFYVSVSGMWVIPGDSDVRDTVTDPTATAGRELTAMSKVEFENSFGFAAAFGYGELTGLRGELEVSYRSLNLDKVTGISYSGGGDVVNFPDVNASPDYDFDLDTWSVMANGIYAFDAMGFRPYVGAGVGFAEHDATLRFTVNLDIDGNGPIAPVDYNFRLSDDDTVFAWQLMAGVGYAVSDSTEIRLGYRYFDTADADLGSLTEDISYDTHNVELGIVHCF